ncbi:MAG: hypothetical protein HY420_01615 [Candidatus Kerfeldbacteria bacterium]|nr:hypothetical protein [Candidatus Kerfeldbacteria bacterium]
MPHHVLEADPELSRMLSREQRKAVRAGGRAQRAESAPPTRPSPEALTEERIMELRTRERQRIEDVIRIINREFGVGGGNMDIRGRRPSHAI